MLRYDKSSIDLDCYSISGPVGEGNLQGLVHILMTHPLQMHYSRKIQARLVRAEFRLDGVHATHLSI